MKVTDHFLSSEEFELVYEPRFKAYKTIPAPVEVQAYYDSKEYFSHANNATSIVARLYALAKGFRNTSKWKTVLSFLGRHFSDGRTISALDFGSGDNSFVRAAPPRVHAIGIDPYTGHNTTNHFDSLASLSAQGLNFDVITLWHSLEHTRDPLQTLNSLIRFLKPGGQLHIAVPNYTSWDAAYYGAYWAGYDVPRHLWHFCPESFTLMSKELQLEIHAQTPQWFDGFYISYLSEKYRGARFPLLLGLMRALRALLTLKALRNPSAIHVVMKKPV